MTRTFVPLPENTVIPAINGGGTIRAAGDEVRAPSLIGTTDTGVSFGPILFELPPDTILDLERLSFLPGDDEDGFLFLTAGGVAAGGALADPETDTDTPTSRRSVLGVLAAALTAGAMTGGVQAAEDDDELVTLNIAEFEIAEPDAPVTVTVLDLVDDVLPQSADILIDQRNARVGEITTLDEGVTLRQVGGEVRVYIRDTRSNLSQILAWARSLLPGDESLTYRRTFPDGAQASDYDEDEFVRLSAHPSVIEPIRQAGEDRTVFEIGNTEIPHGDEGADEAGAWTLLDDELIYEVGSNPPADDEWQVTTRLSAWQAFRQ